MNLQRIELLKTYIAEDPTEPFNHYALACEYLQSEPLKALEIFEKLMVESPSYLPTYYQAATLMVEFEKEAQALKAYEKGMTLAKSQGNQKILRELQTAYNNLLFEID